VLDPLSVENKGNVFEIHCLQYFDGVVFRVPDTIAVSIDAENLLRNYWGDILCHNMKDNHYTAYSSKQKFHQRPSDKVLEQLTNVPEEVRQELDNISKKIFFGKHTTDQKIQALYTFWEDAEYTLDINIPKDHEPVVYMVKKKPPAHCELFATATCILLRLADIPTRYATGFSISNRQDGYWIVRNKDSHAWAQAWDEENSQWINVDIFMNSAISAPTGYASQGTPTPINQRFKAAWLNNGLEGVAKLSVTMTAELCTAVGNKANSVIYIIIVFVSLIIISVYKVLKIHKKYSQNDSHIRKMQKKTD